MMGKRKSEAAKQSLIENCLDFISSWKEEWPSFETDSSLEISQEKVLRALQQLFHRIKKSYPFYYPGYAGQMLKPPHLIAILAYFTTLYINSNNHALDGGPATSELEVEVVSWLAEMFGFKRHLGHLTGGGTIANLEALWAARELHPDQGIAFSSQAHYTHQRVCSLLKIPCYVVNVDRKGKMDLNHLEYLLNREKIGTVVATLGTTSFGSLDPLDQIAVMKGKRRIRIHVDAAYGGFYTLLSKGRFPEVNPLPFQAIEQCDSIVVDPHKHGLQPYGCGCVIFTDPAVGKVYQHNSPYTYFTSDKLHLGEISFECSRPGAAAAAFWTTLKCFPLKRTTGLGSILSQCRKAALRFVDLVEKDEVFKMITVPELDIAAYFAVSGKPTASQISKKTNQIFKRAEQNKEFPLYLSKLKVDAQWLKMNFPELVMDKPEATVLRSVLMKPEHFAYIEKIYEVLLKVRKD